MTGTWKTKGVSAKRLRYGRISSNLPLLFLALFVFFPALSPSLSPSSSPHDPSSAASSCFGSRPNGLNLCGRTLGSVCEAALYLQAVPFTGVCCQLCAPLLMCKLDLDSLLNSEL